MRASPELERALHGNAPRTGEAGIIRAIREVPTQEWLHGNKAATKAPDVLVDTVGALPPGPGDGLRWPHVTPDFTLISHRLCHRRL